MDGQLIKCWLWLMLCLCFWYGLNFCRALEVSMHVLSFVQSQFSKEMSRVDRRTELAENLTVWADPARCKQPIVVGWLEAPQACCTGCSGVALPECWMQSWEKSRGAARNCPDVRCVHGGNMSHCSSYLAVEEYTRPSPKCEFYRFSKLHVARNDWEASDSFWVNVKVPEGLI